MLLNLKRELRRRLRVKGVIHVGAHWAQEHETYVSMGISKFVYIEPCYDAFERLKKRFGSNPNVKLIKCACGSVESKLKMNVEESNQGQSNSLLQPAKHLEYYPDIKFNETEVVLVRRLDELPIEFDQYNLLMMDCQGYEGEVLKGATETIKKMDCVYTEVNTQELYQGCAKLEDIDNLLSDFTRVSIKLEKQGWGDAIYLRK